jgi:hypothetical protein
MRSHWVSPDFSAAEGLTFEDDLGFVKLDKVFVASGLTTAQDRLVAFRRGFLFPRRNSRSWRLVWHGRVFRIDRERIDGRLGSISSAGYNGLRRQWNGKRPE